MTVLLLHQDAAGTNVSTSSRLLEKEGVGNQPFGVANKPTVLQTKLLHMGKSGGGTFIDRAHKLGFVMMHGETQTPRSVEQMQKKKTLILTIRDPVDRFRSNFYWLSLVACRLDRGDKRGEHSRRCNAHKETEKCCKVYKKGGVID